MPAIDPDRLKREVSDLITDFGDAERLRRGTLDLLGRYADRTKRFGSATKAKDTPWEFSAPRPVLSALKRAFRDGATAAPDRGRAAAAALWKTGYREAQLIAAEILGTDAQESVADQVEEWALEADDSVARAGLAEVGLARWRLSDPQRFLARVATWLASRRVQLESLGFAALNGAVADPAFEDLPGIFRMIEGSVEAARGEKQRSLYDLVAALARRSPPEAAGFLIAEVERSQPGARGMARSLLSAFPDEQRARIRRVLSG